MVLASPPDKDPGVIENTLEKDPSEDEEDALTRIYNLLMLSPGDPPNIATVRELLDRLFFNAKRYNLGDVGRLSHQPPFGRGNSLREYGGCI